MSEREPLSVYPVMIQWPRAVRTSLFRFTWGVVLFHQGGSIETPFRSIFLCLVAAAVGAWGQCFYEGGSGASQLVSLTSLVTNWKLLLGIACYIAVMVLFIAAFKIGGELTVLYPVYATTFLWGAAIGVFLLGESLGPAKGLGMAFIVIGVFLTAR